MPYSTLRNWLISVIFFGYMLLIFVLLLLWLVGGFKFDEFTTTASIVVPLLAAHIATAVTFFQRTTVVHNQQRMATRLEAAIALVPPAALILVILSLSVLKGFRLTAITFEEYKTALAAIYGFFGAYIATIVTYYLKDSAEQAVVAPANKPAPDKPADQQ